MLGEGADPRPRTPWGGGSERHVEGLGKEPGLAQHPVVAQHLAMVG